MRSSEIAKSRFSRCVTDVDHDTTQPIPTENSELNFSAPGDCHVTLG